MKITLVQFSPVWEDPAANRDILRSLLSQVPETDLIVLPEMFSTGFVTEPAGVAEQDGASLRFLQETAATRNCAVAGSVATETEGSYRNRFYFVCPDGREVHYDKHHLFTYGGEHRRFTPGNAPVTVEYKGVRILLQVCYDLRFPVFSRNRLCADGRALYDLALYVAGAPRGRLGPPAPGPRHREPVLCSGRQPGRRRPRPALLRTLLAHRPQGPIAYSL